MRPIVLMAKDTYARSIARFTAGLKGRFKQLAEARAAAAVLPRPPQFAQSSQQQPTQLAPSAAPVAGVTSVPPTAVASSSSLARPSVPFSSAQTGLHGSLAAGPRGTASSSAVAVQPAVAAARPVPASYGMVPPPLASYPARPVLHQQ